MHRPRVLVTLADPGLSRDPGAAVRKNDRYLEAVERAGGAPMPLDERAGAAQRELAFDGMQALLLTGGADVDPGRYHQPVAGAQEPEPGRDALEHAAYHRARGAGLPILGICRGLQAINVFEGGSLVQHVEGHQGPAYGEGPALVHPIAVASGSRLAGVLGLDGAAEPLVVNSYHHQGVAPEGVARTLAPAASAPHPVGILVEALESPDPGVFLFAIQCHPERTESTPAAFERLFAAFVDAARRTGAAAS